MKLINTLAAGLISLVALQSTVAKADEANPYAKCYDGRPNSADCVMKVAAEVNWKPGDAREFVLNDTVTFSEPTMSCPNPDDAEATDQQSPDWLASRGCANLSPNVREWVNVGGGSKTLKRNRQVIVTYGCVVPKQRFDQLKSWAASQPRTNWGAESAVQDALRKECRHVVRKGPELP